MNEIQLQQLMATAIESPSLEFKEAKTQFSQEKLYKYCVAIANEGGGRLLLGVSDKVPRRIVGSNAFPDLQKVARDVFRTVGFRVDAESVETSDGRVVVFTIPPRPLGTAYHYDGRYFMRSGDELTAMSEDRLRSIFEEDAMDQLEAPSKFDLDVSDVCSLLDVDSYFALTNTGLPVSNEKKVSRYQEEGFIQETGGRYTITRRGALLFAKDISLFEDIAGKAVRIIRYGSDSKEEPADDVVYTVGYASGFSQLLEMVIDRVPKSEVIVRGIRKSLPMVPDIVIRELLANALIHQDFTLTGMRVTVEIYKNRVEITNPGLPVVPVERFIDGYQSRNERLADAMRRMGICEERSSGIDRVISTVEASQLPAPWFHQGYQRTEVILFGPKQFEKMDRNERVRAAYQHCALQFVSRREMTNTSLRERFGLSVDRAATVSQVIAAAIDEGLVHPDESVGASRKFARYVPFWA